MHPTRPSAASGCRERKLACTALGGAGGGWQAVGIGALVGGAAGAMTGAVATPLHQAARY
jgi:hypothetical protein